MAFVLQTSDGDAAGANAYISVAEFKSYHDDRGNSYATSTDNQIQAAIIKATDHLDVRFTYVGERKRVSQSTEWPRIDVFDRDDNLITGIPEAVKEATAEYALRALSAPLTPDITYDSTGQKIKRKLNRIEGAITEETEYVDGGSSALASYPMADRKLIQSGLTKSKRELARGA